MVNPEFNIRDAVIPVSVLRFRETPCRPPPRASLRDEQEVVRRYPPFNIEHESLDDTIYRRFPTMVVEGLAPPAAEVLREHFSILEALRRRESEVRMRLHIRRSVERLEREAAEEAAEAA